MKKRHSFGKRAIFALLATTLIGTIFGCSGGSQGEPEIQSIEVSPPYKIVYAQGEALSISGLKVFGTYSDGTTRTETVSLANISGYDANTVGTQTLTVTINGKTATFTVTVTAPGGAVLQSITVTSWPAKTVYKPGEALALSGLVVTGTYTDGATRTESVTLSNISGYDAYMTGWQMLTVTINGKTATFGIVVSNAVLQSIAVTSPPSKTVYGIGEALNISGLVVTGTYSDGTTRTESVSLSNISWYNAYLTGWQTLTVTVNGYTATFGIAVNAGSTGDAVLQSIAITSLPYKTVYEPGEALDISGLVITATYSDGATMTEYVGLSTISGYDAYLAGWQTLTVTIDGKTDTFEVMVNAPGGDAVLQSIAITSPPYKTVYELGEDLDISGLIVTGTYSDGTTTEAYWYWWASGSLSVSGYNANTAGTQTLTVTVDGYTATFTVTVNADSTDDAVLQSIAITILPTKTVYELRESLDLSGLVVTGTYSDGTTRTEYGYNVSGYNAYSTGQQTLTVTVNGYTATFTVTVNAVTLQSIAITSPPHKLRYALGEPLEIYGIVVTGTYSDGTTEWETVNLSNISGYNADMLGQQTVTVTVGDKTATFIVNVNVKTAFTLNFSSDPINGIPENIVLYKSGTPVSMTIEIDGTYTSYEWLLNDSETPVSTGASYTLNAADCRLGPNFLMVEVGTTNGAYYAREITFTVNK
ncbi:MAG: bacterial Ig-like domain-containing protein [Treponema sp.]|jgi:hypothetical protein|nr:bacterial Ig-like domain-containing protein [Treponema sp.]